jgi:hypothetical protein
VVLKKKVKKSFAGMKKVTTFADPKRDERDGKQ